MVVECRRYMDVFKWKVKPDMTKVSEPRVKSVKLGESYEQRRPDGLNSNTVKYNVTFLSTHAESQEIDRFLAKHQGVKAFLWQPPYQADFIKVICRKWSEQVKLMRSEIEAEFEQVVN